MMVANRFANSGVGMLNLDKNVPFWTKKGGLGKLICQSMFPVSELANRFATIMIPLQDLANQSAPILIPATLRAN